MTPQTDAERLASLTPRQREVLEYIARGLSNADISTALAISANTVKVHVAGVLKALDVANRTEAVFIWRQASGDDVPNLAARTGRPPVAVLPFSVDAHADDAALGRLLAEDLIARMGAWRWFPVLGFPATSAMGGDVPDFGALTGAGAVYVITGRVRRVGAALRVQAALHDVGSCEQLWAERIEHDLGGDPARALDGVTRTLSGRIGAELLKLDHRVAKPDGFDAWSAASSALAGVFTASPKDNARALELADRALSLDEELTIAWYAKAAALYQRAFHQWSDDPAGDLRGFRKTAQHCVDLDSEDSACQELAGFARLIVGDFATAIVHLERAVALNPANAQAWSELGQALTFGGRERVERYCARGVSARRLRRRGACAAAEPDLRPEREHDAGVSGRVPGREWQRRRGRQCQGGTSARRSGVRSWRRRGDVFRARRRPRRTLSPGVSGCGFLRLIKTRRRQHACYAGASDPDGRHIAARRVGGDGSRPAAAAVTLDPRNATKKEQCGFS